MKYQLVLQWPATSIDDYDRLVEIEETLIAGLFDETAVDGHDSGSGEMNIFILTNSPQSAFNQIESILSSQEYWNDTRAAYREAEGGKYTVLWPKYLTEFTIK